jgi:hypothetical protein
MRGRTFSRPRRKQTARESQAQRVIERRASARVNEGSILKAKSATRWQVGGLPHEARRERWVEQFKRREFDYFVQAVDDAGNASMSGNKGLYFEAEPLKTYLPIILRNASR